MSFKYSEYNCPFCDIVKGRIETKLFVETKEFIVFHDRFPVTKGHTLIIPKRHYTYYEDLMLVHLEAIPQLIQIVMKKLRIDDSTITGFNVGFNGGESAGQTVPHFHIHVIPRRNGDMEDPTGGVRGVIPEKQKY